jgi:hypothetical protein
MDRGEQVFTTSFAESHSALRHGNATTIPQRKGSLPLRMGRGLIGSIGAVVALGSSGAVYASVAEAADARAYPPPGRMVDVHATG